MPSSLLGVIYVLFEIVILFNSGKKLSNIFSIFLSVLSGVFDNPRWGGHLVVESLNPGGVFFRLFSARGSERCLMGVGG